MTQAENTATATVIPTGRLIKLNWDQVVPNPNNPRMLFDEEPLRDLRENIRLHGVLVPITVFSLPGAKKFGILDGARRHRCCMQLAEEGLKIELPANVVEPPDPLAGLLYMFSIHNFRESWELMPTALALKTVMRELGETDSQKLSSITGLSEPQVERCKLLLKFPKKYQELSLDPNPKTRIPSNFWIELYPLLESVKELLPDLYEKEGRDGVTEAFITKYRAKRIKSVIHFRRILEALEVTESEPEQHRRVVKRLKEYVQNVELETRQAFDEFIVDQRRVRSAIQGCEQFILDITKQRIEHAIEADKDALILALKKVQKFVSQLLVKLEGRDPPDKEEEEDN